MRHRLTCPHTSHQNGIVKRKHMKIVEIGLTLLAHASMPMKFLDHSFTNAVYLINKLPPSVLPEFTTPFQLLFNKQPSYIAIRIFRCACYPHLRPYNNHKLELKSSKCLYLGVSPTHKGHKCLNMDGRIFISKDVVFNETKFPYTSSISPSPRSHKPTTSSSLRIPHICANYTNIVQHPIFPPTIDNPYHSPLQEPHTIPSRVSNITSHMTHDSTSSDIPQISYDTLMSIIPQPYDTTSTPEPEPVQASYSN